ncbi:sugar phosphate nucleotidyltransferase [Penaeicola halotolerans]|uniref:sugar phosphate nucleotidyltransferase n=1 Tax=Penaeicola halotolerans TaxID=2793196 RepID=UPI001CF7F144|nr:sugar phosphate nucleotidyltransferase [Penaeicola halotolerans]
MKVIIPVAGVGSRLRPHTHTQPKALVPVAGKAILGHIIDGLIEAQVTEFVFIIGYLGNKIEQYIKDKYTDKGLKIEFVVQPEPREGIAHALYAARHAIAGDSEVLITLGDTIVNMDFQKILQSEYSTIGIKKVEDPSLFGVAELDKEGWIKRMVEKPVIPKSNLALVGIYKINNPKLLIEGASYLLDHQHKTHGEYHLTDALMYMVEKGEKIQVVEVDNWYDCGRGDSLLETNSILLNKPEFKTNKKHNFPNTIIIPPVSIGANCKIERSIIGPNVAIGDNTIIKSSIIEHSIVGSFSELSDTVLSRSIIGNDTSIAGHGNSINVGDNTELNFNA